MTVTCPLCEDFTGTKKQVANHIFTSGNETHKGYNYQSAMTTIEANADAVLDDTGDSTDGAPTADSVEASEPTTTDGSGGSGHGSDNTPGDADTVDSHGDSGSDGDGPIPESGGGTSAGLGLSGTLDFSTQTSDADPSDADDDSDDSGESTSSDGSSDGSGVWMLGGLAAVAGLGATLLSRLKSSSSESNNEQQEYDMV